jgi:hypothetical protein
LPNALILLDLREGHSKMTILKPTFHMLLGTIMTELIKNLTFRLVPRPSFWEGMGRVLDIGGGLSIYNSSATSADADCKAIASDWNAIGQDFKMAVKEYEQKAE